MFLNKIHSKNTAVSIVTEQLVMERCQRVRISCLSSDLFMGNTDPDDMTINMFTQYKPCLW